jgi:protein ImuB
MLWIALYLPRLALQVSHRGLLPDLPQAISDGALQRPLVIEANGPAQACGITPGMPVSAAHALAAELVVWLRDPGKEQSALHTLAGWAGQFTPTVGVDKEGVLLEVAPSLRLFGGLMKLAQRIQEGAAQLGFEVVAGMAPIPMAAMLLARARVHDASLRGCRRMADLPAKLDGLPVQLMDWSQEASEALASLGVTTLGQCRALPREGLMRRFGLQVVDEMDRAYGELPDPRDSFVPPPVFFSRIELSSEVEQLEQLKQVLQLLLQELEGYLRARQQGATQLLLKLEQGRDKTQELTVGFSLPHCDAGECMNLVSAHMERVTLEAPVRALAVQVDKFVPYAALNHSLLPGSEINVLGWQQLNEQLAARLPAGSLYRLGLQGDHRPELAWLRDGESNKSIVLPDLPRPAWLLMHPRSLSVWSGQPQFEGMLTLLTGAERIEAGWWDDRPVSRDYYIARNPQGQLCWIYQDHHEQQWYLHGFFA